MRDCPDDILADDPWSSFDGLPGHPLMWLLILSELAVFGAGLLGFSVARALDPAGFAAGQAVLDVELGGVNTILLLTSGWAAARATRAVHRGALSATRHWLAGAILLGAGFVAVKALEYADKASAGHGLEGDTFFTLYFLLTGFHLAHVVAGMAVLALVARRPTIPGIETGTAFWHMVDLVWLVLFAVLYLLR